jgi:ribosomal protein S18 acetylase RimI-like enzyme
MLRPANGREIRCSGASSPCGSAWAGAEILMAFTGIERVLLGFEMRYNDLIERASDKAAIQRFAEATEYKFYTTLQDYWHLATLAVSPQFQRRGIGLMLLNFGLEIASREGVPVTLEASLTGQFLYTKAGFQIIERSRIRDDLEGVAMLWEGDASKGRWLLYGEDGSVSLKG